MKPIESANFGATADDYVRHRAGFPKSLFDRLIAWNIGTGNQTMVDLGTGTGSLARGFALRNNEVVGIDPDQKMLDAAAKLDLEAGVTIEYRLASAEETGLKDNSADVVTAGQCWHWFDRQKAAAEIRRILEPNGKLIVAHYDWIPLKDNVVRLTEKLIEHYNPRWLGGNQFGIHPQTFRDLGEAGFHHLQSFTYDEPAIYDHETWRGRIRASAGVGASLSQAEVTRFDADLADLLIDKFPREPLYVPHRVFALMASPDQ